MTDLLSRLQSATGPNRELDAEIALAHGWTKPGIAFGKPYWQSPTGEICPQPPEFTKYTEVALTLVPKLDKAEGALWLKMAQFAGAQGFGKEAWNAEIWGIKNGKEVKWWGIHNILAIALLIAIYKTKQVTP